MGQMHFLTPSRNSLPVDAERHAYVTGLDLIPMPVRAWWGNDQMLHLERSHEESGHLCIPWCVDGHGQLMMATSTLVDREQPYLLSVELARGMLNRIRNRTAVWQSAGLELPVAVVGQIKSAVDTFIEAATSQDQGQAAITAAGRVLQQSLEAMNEIGREYAKHVLERRQQESSPLTTLLAGNLGHGAMPMNAEPMFKAAFNSAVVPIRWRDIQPTPDQWQWTATDKQFQWCQRHGLKVLAGPLISLGRQDHPNWLTNDDLYYDPLQERLQQFLNAVVQRYRGQVHLWHATAGLNVPLAMPLNDEHRLRLAVLAVGIVRSLDPRAPVFISVDEPWGEYMTRGDTRLAPLQFAEMLVRADLGLSGIGLELNIGYWPAGMYPRDILEISDFIDIWSMLGLPLIVMATIPSSLDPDPLACPGAPRPLRACLEDGATPEGQRALVERLAPLLIAKQSVHGLVWNQVFDSFPHYFANAGLFTAKDLPKPALSPLIALRRDYLS